MSENDLRAALAEERRAADLHGYFADRETDARYEAARAATDAALSAILADRERYAREKAGEALRMAADEYGLGPYGKPWLPQAYMRARADRLTDHQELEP